VADLVAVVRRHLGRPWSATGFDCWAFVRTIYAEAYGIHLPILPGVDAADPIQAARTLAETSATGDWRHQPIPSDGDAVVMGRRAGRPHHVGVWLSADGGLVAHCDAAAGVRCHALRHLAASGWGGFSYYRHRDRA
jgi:cell wall-associated NlpC family hydrolase